MLTSVYYANVIMQTALNVACIKIHTARPCVFSIFGMQKMRLKFHPVFSVDSQNPSDGTAEENGGRLPYACN